MLVRIQSRNKISSEGATAIRYYANLSSLPCIVPEMEHPHYEEVVTTKPFISVGTVLVVGTVLAFAQSADNSHKDSHNSNTPEITRTAAPPPQGNGNWGWFPLLALAGVPGLLASRKRRQVKRRQIKDETSDQVKAT